MKKNGFFKRLKKGILEFFEEDSDETIVSFGTDEKEEKINWRNYLIASVFIFLIIAGLFIFMFYIRNPNISKELVALPDTYESLKVHEINYTKITDCSKFNMVSNVKKYMLSFDLDNYMLEKVPQNETYLKLSKSQDFSCVDSESLEIDYKLPSPYSIPDPDRIRIGYKFSTLQDWKSFSNVNLIIYNDGKSAGILFFIIEDKDGDWWHVRDDTILDEEGWLKLTMPLEKFKVSKDIPQFGNKRKNFEAVTSYYILIMEREDNNIDINKAIYVNSLYLSN